MSELDIIVVGAGPGGYVAALRAARLGLRTALVEKEPRLGGTCLNVGCIPTKALLESSEQYHRIRGGLTEHGIGVDGVSLDLEALMARKARIVGELTDGIRLLMKRHKVRVCAGRGRLVAPGRVRVEGDAEPVELQARAIVLATGSEPSDVPGLPVDATHLVTSTEALAFDRVPAHLVVIGAGAIGLELGSVWQRLGARVTVVEMLPQIAPHADVQVSKMLLRSLKKQGLEVRLRSQVTAVETDGDQVRLTVVDHRDGRETLTADKVLVAVGRRPCLRGLGLREAGVALTEHGRVRVDERYTTSVEGVYAIGDLIDGPMLAHRASEEGVAVAEIVAGNTPLVPAAIPSVIYTWPELAQVGMTEVEATERGLECRSARHYFKANGRAKTMGAEEGLVKVVAEASTGRLLGVHVVGPHASELIGQATLALGLEAGADALADAVTAHPTLSEALKEAALAVQGRAIHG